MTKITFAIIFSSFSSGALLPALCKPNLGEIMTPEYTASKEIPVPQGQRLSNSQRCSIALPEKHKQTEHLIDEYHQQLVEATLNLLESLQEKIVQDDKPVIESKKSLSSDFLCCIALVYDMQLVLNREEYLLMLEDEYYQEIQGIIDAMNSDYCTLAYHQKYTFNVEPNAIKMVELMSSAIPRCAAHRTCCCLPLQSFAKGVARLIKAIRSRFSRDRKK